MPPFIEINGMVYAVVGWTPDMPEYERYEFRRLSAEETICYRRLKCEADVELWANMQSGD
jgi:hypothetical protein